MKFCNTYLFTKTLTYKTVDKLRTLEFGTSKTHFLYIRSVITWDGTFIYRNVFGNNFKNNTKNFNFLLRCGLLIRQYLKIRKSVHNFNHHHIIYLKNMSRQKLQLKMKNLQVTIAQACGNYTTFCEVTTRNTLFCYVSIGLLTKLPLKPNYTTWCPEGPYSKHLLPLDICALRTAK